MLRLHHLGVAVLMAVVLALPTTAVLAAHLAPASPRQPHYIECSSTTEADNIQVNNSRNPFWDDLGNQWVVYYDVQRDSRDGTPCNMRVDIRIFNPSPDGAWKGTVVVVAYENGVLNANSRGQVSSAGTYQAHFVWRGPWFAADVASYQIQTNEYNGDTLYLRSSTTVSP